MSTSHRRCAKRSLPHVFRDDSPDSAGIDPHKPEECRKKSSSGLASNLPFREWGQIITDARLVAAVIDRVTFNAHIIETGTQSYRHRTSRTRPRSRRES